MEYGLSFNKYKWIKDIIDFFPKPTPGKPGQNLIVFEWDKKVLRFTWPVFDVWQPPLSGLSLCSP